VSEQDVEATARADQIEAGIREMVDCLIKGASEMPAPARRLVLTVLMHRIGDYAEEVTAAMRDDWRRA